MPSKPFVAEIPPSGVKTLVHRCQTSLLWTAPHEEQHIVRSILNTRLPLADMRQGCKQVVFKTSCEGDYHYFRRNISPQLTALLPGAAADVRMTVICTEMVMKTFVSYLKVATIWTTDPIQQLCSARRGFAEFLPVGLMQGGSVDVVFETQSHRVVANLIAPLITVLYPGCTASCASSPGAIQQPSLPSAAHPMAPTPSWDASSNVAW